MAIALPLLELAPEIGLGVAEGVEGLGSLLGFGAEATESSSFLPALTAKNVALGSGVVIGAKNLVQHGPSGTLSGVQHDLTTLVGSAGSEVGQLTGEALKGVSKSIFSDASVVELGLLAFGAYYLWQRI